MDVHDVLGLGKDASMYGSNNTDAFEVINPATKQFVTLRVPYPLGFFPRSAAQSPGEVDRLVRPARAVGGARHIRQASSLHPAGERYRISGIRSDSTSPAVA